MLYKHYTYTGNTPYRCFPIQRSDVEKWLEDFKRAKRIINCLVIDESDKRELFGRMDDGIYLATLVESLMMLEEPDGMLERARERQRNS